MNEKNGIMSLFGVVENFLGKETLYIWRKGD